MISKQQVVAWLEASRDVLEENKGYLTELDSPIGDADHGTNMARGFNKLLEKLPNPDENDIGKLLKSSGMALMASIGGASGPLYGTFFMRAGDAVKDKQALALEDLTNMLTAGVEGLKQRGRAEVGEKTMIDAWQPAIDALQAGVTNNDDIAAAVEACVQAAKTGMESTTPLIAKKGRASYLGERSIGHQDPGATSTYMLLQALLDVVNNTSA
jgi:phosphoenolpyruvate---glycerone phosphotransferase subunit DhaL